MGVQERRDRERDQTRAKIMNAARDLFVRDGYDAVSMRRIAEAIEYSPTAIYVHFKDKDALFRDLCREDFRRLAGAFNELSQVKDPIERIIRLGHGYVRFALDFPNHYRLLFMTPQPPDPDAKAMVHKGNPDEDAYAMLRLAVTEAIAQKLFRPEFMHAELSTQILWGVAHGVASLQIIKGDDQWIEWSAMDVRTRGALDAIMRGMLLKPAELPAVAVPRKGRAR